MVMAEFWYAAEPILPCISLLVVSGGGSEGDAFRRARGGHREVGDNIFGYVLAKVREDEKLRFSKRRALTL